MINKYILLIIILFLLLKNNIENMSDKIYISLGNNCDPRIYIKNKLKLSKKNGYNSCPFDLCITKSFKDLCKVIETDFEYFFDNLHLIKWWNAKGNRSKAGPGNTAISNKYNMVFNHEGASHSHLFKEGKNDDNYFTRYNYKNFKDRYSNRINNFNNYINNYKDIIFIYKNYKDFDEIYFKNLINKKYGEKNISFLKI